ncbi:MAG TPA: hypothetical protein VKA59_22255 [Vicinamibacterales bacterium]|nr:hypothetical protein [Vicinamibacterales bacterium]
MNSNRQTSLGWLQVLPLVVIGVLAFMLWRPAPDPPPSDEQETKIADLAARLGSSSSSASDIDDRLRSFGPFPPDAKATRALADALIACVTARLDETRRQQLARQLFSITVIGDRRAETVPAALLGIQHSAAASGCTPAALDEIMRTARAVASTDPAPRRNWW